MTDAALHSRSCVRREARACRSRQCCRRLGVGTCRGALLLQVLLLQRRRLPLSACCCFCALVGCWRGGIRGRGGAWLLRLLPLRHIGVSRRLCLRCSCTVACVALRWLAPWVAAPAAGLVAEQLLQHFGQARWWRGRRRRWRAGLLLPSCRRCIRLMVRIHGQAAAFEGQGWELQPGRRDKSG